MGVKEILEELESQRNRKNLDGMARFGINTNNAYGVDTPTMKAMAKSCGKNHELALELWDTGKHEARIIAAMVAEPKKMTEETADKWCHEFDSWDVCDQCCLKLLRYTPFAEKKIREWTQSEMEFVRRAGFALMATYAVGNKITPDETFEDYLELIVKYSEDERNFVKKAVNWALRQIGKKNVYLHAKALKASQELSESDCKSARWIGKDALRELTSAKTIERIEKKKL